MHMADALISPAVGGAMWAAAAGLIAYSSKIVNTKSDDRQVPLMGVLGAFIFAAQMINFTIPATGSSGHLGGGMVLAILLGPCAAFLTMASVLIVQSLFFADGGLLALGCNIFNLGFFPCFVAYPLLYKKIAGDTPTRGRIIAGAVIAAVFGLQAGALAVVLQTFFSDISALPFRTFVLLMQPIHLAIGLAEGFVTAAVVLFVRRARPEILISSTGSAPSGQRSLRPVLAWLLGIAAVTGIALSWFASSAPDGLEWALFKSAGTEALTGPADGIHHYLGNVQDRTTLLPGYTFKTTPGEDAADEEPLWPAVDSGTSISGLVGGFLTLIVSLLIGLATKRRKEMQ